MYESYLEGIMVVVLLLSYLLVLSRAKNRRAYLLYFVSGSLIGFYFDSIAISQGYYSYFPYGFVVLGMPVLITLAEGFAVAITIYLFEWLAGPFAEPKARGRR
jgi:hypothetical protein